MLVDKINSVYWGSNKSVVVNISFFSKTSCDFFVKTTFSSLITSNSSIDCSNFMFIKIVKITIVHFPNSKKSRVVDEELIEFNNLDTDKYFENMDFILLNTLQLEKL